MNTPRWTFRAIAVAVGVVLALTAAPRASAQPKAQPQAPNNPNGFAAGAVPQPAFNVPGIQFNPDPYFINPGLYRTQVTPVNPFTPNPFFTNPFLPDPYFPGRTDRNPADSPFGLRPQGGLTPVTIATPPVAVQQPGFLQWRAPGLLVNPWSGTAVNTYTGVARTSDGNLFYNLAPNGIPTAFGGGYGTGIFYDPNHGSFLNPATGVIVRPGTANVFIPWLP